MSITYLCILYIYYLSFIPGVLELSAVTLLLSAFCLRTTLRERIGLAEKSAFIRSRRVAASITRLFGVRSLSVGSGVSEATLENSSSQKSDLI